MRRTQAAVLTMVALTGTLVACSIQPNEVGPQSDPSGQAKIQPRDTPPKKSEDRAAPNVGNAPQKQSEKSESAAADTDESEPAEPAKPRTNRPKPSKETKQQTPPKKQTKKVSQAKDKKAPPAKNEQVPPTKDKKVPPAKKKPSQPPKADKPPVIDAPSKPEVRKPTPPENPKPNDEAKPPAPPAKPEVGDIVQVDVGAIWWPSFQLMPFAEGAHDFDGKITFDNAGWSSKELKLYTNFNASRVPSHQCGVLPEVYPDEFQDEAFRAQMQPLAEDYANCLYDSWRPLLNEIGAVPFDHITVTACPGPGCDVMQPNFAAVAMDDQIILSELTWAWSGPHFSRVIAHETAHILQTSVRVDRTYGSVVGAGSPGDLDYSVVSRRHELQAECLGTMMLNEAKPLPFREHTWEFPPMGNDEMHGDWESVEFWVAQGLKGQVGECNAYLADPSLTTFRG